MPGKSRFYTYFALCLTLVLITGCASHNAGQQPFSKNSDYKEMMRLQQQRAAAKPEPEPVLPQGFESTAESCEQMGDVYLKQGNLVGAFSEYQKSLEKQPDRTTARYKLGMLFVNRGQADEALREFDTILSKDPNNAYAYYGRARARFLQDKVDLAEEDLKTGLRFNDSVWQAHTLLGIVYDRQERHAAAEEEYQKAVAIQPKSAAIYNDLGVSRYLMGKFDEAAEAFLKAFSIEPTNPRICNNLGLTLFRLGRTEDAIEAFRRGSGEAVAYNNVGYLEMKEKKYDQARIALEKAIEVKPSYYSRAQKNLEKVKAAEKRKEGQGGGDGAPE
jgi:Flp pilus assembly protein TadD